MALQMTDTKTWEPDAIVADIVVYKTKNYDQFKRVLGNREIVMFNVNRIIQALQKENLMDHFPAFISNDGYNLDGQHRLEACKANDLWFYFTVAQKPLSDFVIADLNSTHRRWTVVDYINYYATKGRAQYIYFQELIATYKLSPNVILELVSVYRRSAEQIRSGDLSLFENEEEKRAIVAFIEGYIALKPFMTSLIFPNTKFVRAVRQLFQYVNAEQVVAELIRNQRPFQAKADTPEYLREFEEFFNYRRAEKNYIRFF